MDCYVPRRAIQRAVKCLNLITVEPTMFLYMMAFMTTSVVEQAFYVDKACRVNHNFTKEICDDIANEKYKEYNKKVQITVSQFHQWNDIASHVVPIVLAFFVGAWSDRRGRKLPLLLGLFGKFYFSCMIVLNSLQASWPVEYVIYTAAFPSTLTGADVAIFAAAFTYLFDVSSSENRTLRVTILEVCYLVTMPTGIALGSYLFSQVTHRSFAIMFAINSALLLASIIYSLIFLKWQTSERQRPLAEAGCIVTDFFDLGHISATLRTLGKHRPRGGRTYLLLMIAAMGFYAFQRDERNMSYLFMQLKHNWSFAQNSTFRTFISAFQIVFLLLGVPIMSKLLGWRDTLIMMIGAAAHAIARVFYSTADESWLLYLGGAFASCGPVANPMLRSIVSKIVPFSERGKAFSMMSVTDNAIPLFSGIIYNQVYKATIHTQPWAIFYVTISTQLAVFLSALYVHCRSDDADFSNSEEEPYQDATDPLTTQSCSSVHGQKQ